MEIGQFLEVTEKAVNRTFEIFSHRDIMLKKYIACILDEQQPFNLLDRYLSKLNYYSIKSYKSMTEEDLVMKLK